MIKLPPRMRLLMAAAPSRKRVAAWAAKFAALLVVFLIFFIPAQKDSAILISNMNSLDGQIDDLKKISASLLTQSELTGVEERLKEFDFKLIDLSKAGTLVDFLTQKADENHLNVIQMYSDTPSLIKDETGKEQELNGKKLMWLPINFRVETDYKNFANFLRALASDPRSNFIVESMLIKKTPPSESLQCDVTVSFVAK